MEYMGNKSHIFVEGFILIVEGAGSTILLINFGIWQTSLR